MRQILQYHPVIGYTFVPGIRARLDNDAQGYFLRANETGFRSEREFVKDKALGVFRILLFGDSFTAGDSVSNKDRYSDQIEQIAENVEIYNFGLPGTGTDQQYLAYREIGRHFEHDLVMICVLVENIRRIVARYRNYDDDAGKDRLFAKPYFELTESGSLELRHVPVARGPIAEDALPETERQHVDRGGHNQLLRRVVNALGSRVKDHAQRLSRYQPLPAYDDPESYDWRLMKAILRQWTSESDTPVLICPIPLYQYVEETASPDGYRSRFAELAAWNDVFVHDPLDDMCRVPIEERRSYRFPRDVHPTKEGHLVLARSFARGILRVRSATK